ncbi:G-type lectin S-receptor-like serine/threonine-protein kinase LECRK3 [Silene latifolia]|uniref:G-type lectin S-receptor-like serine/threonine-protein kinase LECRK3 n=1 Tax=Silene latifolia TaxID=37657 RepID=UPI003D76EE22
MVRNWPYLLSYILVFYLLLTLLQSPASCSQNGGEFQVGQSLFANSIATSLLSPSSHFAFGFYPLPENNNLFLLSIWYAKIPDTIVWYANEGNPVSQGSKLTITANESLVLTDPQGTGIWNTADQFSGGGVVSYGFMNDSGNFALVSSRSSSVVVWQTFDHPTDTLLPSQVLGAGGEVDCRVSEANFTKGRFQLCMLHDGNLVLNTRDESTGFAYGAYYVSGTNDAANPETAGKELVYGVSGDMYILMKNGSRFDLVTLTKLKSTKDYYQRATLNYNGVLTWYYYPRSSKGDKRVGWSEIQSFPDNICMRIASYGGDLDSGACGYNNICSIGEDQKPICNCPPSYSLIDSHDMNGSCEPDFKPDICEKGGVKGEYRLIQLENTDWPFADYARLDPCTEEECKTSCLNDCFCSTIIFDGISSCWKNKLPLSNGRQDSEVARTAWLKVGNVKV